MPTAFPPCLAVNCKDGQAVNVFPSELLFCFSPPSTFFPYFFLSSLYCAKKDMNFGMWYVASELYLMSKSGKEGYALWNMVCNKRMVYVVYERAAAFYRSSSSLTHHSDKAPSWCFGFPSGVEGRCGEYLEPRLVETWAFFDVRLTTLLSDRSHQGPECPSHPIPSQPGSDLVTYIRPE